MFPLDPHIVYNRIFQAYNGRKVYYKTMMKGYAPAPAYSDAYNPVEISTGTFAPEAWDAATPKTSGVLKKSTGVCDGWV
jgi:hypothetical protein